MGLFSQMLGLLQSWQDALFGPDADILSSAGHFCEYAVFGILLANALRCHVPMPRAWLAAVALASLYGITDEFHQAFVPTRTPDVFDWVVDTLAALLGAFAASRFLRSRRL